ncbi:MAG TPA: hypothetical protein VHD90_23165 [Phototrophicaceae bacterium]|nr:hypothetical protein [Phototrophicaceae bacterium]
MIRKLFLLLIIVLTFASVHAAPGSPQALLEGPLLAADVAAQDRILIYDIGTGTQRELTFGTGWQHIWGFSPDGCQIVFTSSEGSAPASLYTAKIDGSDVRQLVAATPAAGNSGASGVWEPQWGADRIAYTQINADGTHRIAWINPTTNETGMYSVTGNEVTARWSPDGKWLVYMSYESRIAGADTFSTAAPTQPGQSTTTLTEADLWIVSSDGSTKYRLTNFPVGTVSQPRWSPDSELIGFVYSPSANNDQFWMIGNSPSAIPTQLSYQYVLALDLTWLPDSTAMLASARNLQNVTENRLWKLPLTGNIDQKATQYLNDPSLDDDDYPRFSADGHWLAVRSEYALALVNTSDGSWSWLDQTDLADTPPVWSPATFKGEAACSS